MLLLLNSLLNSDLIVLSLLNSDLSDCVILQVKYKIAALWSQSLTCPVMKRLCLLAARSFQMASTVRWPTTTCGQATRVSSKHDYSTWPWSWPIDLCMWWPSDLYWTVNYEWICWLKMSFWTLTLGNIVIICMFYVGILYNVVLVVISSWVWASLML